jgi:hypothetical protein
MGREANFSELREAIRQGQAKIAQGLKTGQMRSDRDKGSQQAPRTRLDPAHEVLGKKPTLTEKSALFDRHKKPKLKFKMPSFPRVRLPRLRLPQISLASIRPMLLGIGAVLAVAAVVLVVFWIGKALIGLVPERSPVADEPVVRQPVGTSPVEPQPVTPPRQTSAVSSPPAESGRAVVPPVVTRTGDNVIVIQNITTSRENELLPVRDFFAKHGIATEIVRSGNNYSRLVTRDRFENPNRSGSDGHEMRMRIRALGKQYPAQTGDTKFGNEPFQDAYGLLRP